MSVVSVELPREVIDLIIAEAKFDFATLRQCATISRPFLASSLRHLYASIILSSASQCERLCGALTSNPELVPLIHELCIMDGWAQDCAPFDTVIGLLGDCPGSSLQSLKFMHPESSKARSTHPFLFANSTVRIQKLLMSQSLRSLSVDHVPLCSFPIRLLMSAPSLRELSFRAPGCLFCSPHTRASPISIKPAPALASPLRTLDISGDHLNLLLRHAWFNLLHLRKLCIATPNNQLYSLVAELLEISDDMVAFRWDFPVWTYFHSWRPCPIKFPRNLRLLVFTLGNSDTLCTTLDLIAESAVMPPSIEQIVLVGHTLARAMGNGGSAAGKELAAAFTDKVRYPCLRDVYVLHDVGGDRSCAEFLGWRDTCRFPTLRAMGLVKLVEGSRRQLENIVETLEAAILG